MAYIRNAWYAAAWSEDIGRSLFSRTLLDDPVLFYRRLDGGITAMRDRCPHRIVPLSMGHLIGDDVECLYHGLKFDCHGVCVANPNGNGAIPRAATVRSFAVEERWNVVWIWMGEAATARPELIPDLHWIFEPDRYTETHGTTKLPASYLLVVDNLMDLRHVAFLHQALEPREHARLPVNVVEGSDHIWARISSPSSAPPALFAQLKAMSQPVDHWQDLLCYPPGALIIFYGVTDPGADREAGLETFNISLVTPETEKTSHYLWASARNFDLQDGALTTAFKEGSAYAFANEDAPMLEAQQRAIGDLDVMDCGPVLLSNDVPAVRVRRMIERAIKLESVEAKPIASRPQQTTARSGELRQEPAISEANSLHA